MSKVQDILDLLNRGVAYHHIASRTGVTESYVRAVRSRYTTPAPPRKARKPQQRLGYRRNPTGQSREELRELAETLCRWRTEGRWADEADRDVF